MHRKIAHAGPAMAFAGWKETLRASIGVSLGMLALALLLAPDLPSARFGLFLIAPFGASAVLLFALPNSPLAQPWSAVIGNSVSALAALALLMLTDNHLLQIIIAPGLAVLVMMLCRALHPPGGAVALLAVLNPEPLLQSGWLYVLAPVAIGTLALVPVAALFAHLTGRHYPFRQPAAPAGDPAPLDRLALSRAELSDLLLDYRQSANIGVEDLARLIAAAERLAASHESDHLTAADIMSHDLVTVTPETPFYQLADIFRDRGFSSLPVTGPGQVYEGVIFPIHLIRAGQAEAARSQSRFSRALAALLRPDNGQPLRAAAVMDREVPCLGPDAPLPQLLSLLAEGRNDAVPVLEGARIIGIVTRTDLIAALARRRGSET